MRESCLPRVCEIFNLLRDIDDNGPEPLTPGDPCKFTKPHTAPWQEWIWLLVLPAQGELWGEGGTPSGQGGQMSYNNVNS